MEDTGRTEQQDDSARRILDQGRKAAAHVRVVHGRASEAVFDVALGGIVVGRDDGEVRIDDSRVSRRHIRLACRASGWTLEDLGSRNGGYVDGAPFQPRGQIVIGDGALIRIGHSLLVFRLSPRPSELEVDDSAFPGVSPAAHEVRRRLALLSVAPGHALVLGETGTGKERVARAIAGARKPFIAQNCGELRKELARSELFGHVQGAFSGATQAKPGLIDAAGAGALFLDEVGELELDVQVDLLRFLENGTYRPVGGQKDLLSKARIVAATNVDLDRAVLDRRFRRDLLARLRASNAPLKLPALRDRREDIVAWALRFAKEAERDVPALWTAGSLECLLLYEWPDNLRELRGLVRDLIANASPQPWPTERLPEHIQAHRSALREPRPLAPPAPVVPPVGDPSLAAIEAALREAGGEVAAAARHLKIEKTKLYRLCNRAGIKLEDYRAGTSPKEQ